MEIAGFRRLPAESIAAVLDRLSDLRPRAQQQGIAVNCELLSFIMLRAASISDIQLMQLLHPDGFTYPSDARQSDRLMRELRPLEERPERVPMIEGTAPDVAHLLASPAPTAAPGAAEPWAELSQGRSVILLLADLFDNIG